MGFQGYREEEARRLNHHQDPLVFELDRLRSILKDKDKEVSIAQAEIKALRATESLKTRAVDELENELQKLDDKLRITENLLQRKNLEIVKLKEEKKNALAAQFAAEATLRRVHADQKTEDPIPIESLLAPLMADNRIYKNEVASLLEDNKALERLTKSKEAALLETEKALRSALGRAFTVEDIQNQNTELKKKVEICREENRVLEKSSKQKVQEVEKLTQTIWELEEAILAGGSAANVIRDYQRQISELKVEIKTLERELARAQVSANRVATVVANGWKDDNDKVMPVKQWLEDRRTLQTEMQRLREKLAITERTAKAEARLKDKLKLRLRTLEEGLKNVPVTSSPNTTESYRSPKTPKSNHILGFLSNAGSRKGSITQRRTTGSPLQKLSAGSGKEGGNKAIRVTRRSLWVSKSKVGDEQVEETTDTTAKTGTNVSISEACDEKTERYGESKSEDASEGELLGKGSENHKGEDMVSGFRIKYCKEVLRKYCKEKDTSSVAKDKEIKMLTKKVDAQTKMMQVELRKAEGENSAKSKGIATIDGKSQEDNRLYY